MFLIFFFQKCTGTCRSALRTEHRWIREGTNKTCSGRYLTFSKKEAHPGHSYVFVDDLARCAYTKHSCICGNVDSNLQDILLYLLYLLYPTPRLPLRNRGSVVGFKLAFVSFFISLYFIEKNSASPAGPLLQRAQLTRTRNQKLVIIPSLQAIHYTP